MPSRGVCYGGPPAGWVCLARGGVCSRGVSGLGGVPGLGGGLPCPGVSGLRRCAWSGRVPGPGGSTPGGPARRPPLKADSYCCGRYASYWNAFLLSVHFNFKDHNPFANTVKINSGE